MLPPTDATAPAPAPADAPITLSFFNGALDKHAKTKETNWRRFFTSLRQPKLTDRVKLELPAWSPAIFAGDKRENDNVISLSAIVLDFDNEMRVRGRHTKVTLPPERRTTQEQALPIWRGTLAFTYSSPSDSTALRKFRLVLPTSRPLTRTEYETVIRAAHARHRQAGHVLDPLLDEAHIWFFGARRNDDYQAIWQDGEPLDVDSILAVARIKTDDVAPDQDIPQEWESIGEGEVASIPAEERVRRATRRIQGWDPKVNADGSADLLRVATVLVRGYCVSGQDAFSIINQHYLPKIKKSWKDHQIQKRLDDAASYSAIPLGFCLRRLRGRADATMFGPSAPEEAERTDHGNALRLAAFIKDTVRYCVDWHSFVRWNGKFWEKDHHGHLVRADMGRLTERWLRDAMAIEDADKRGAAIAWALKSQAAARLSSAVDLAKGFEGLRCRADVFDADPFILNTTSGVLLLREVDPKTGTVKQEPHNPRFMCTKMTAVAYRPGAFDKSSFWALFCRQSAARADGSYDSDIMLYRRRRRGSYLSGAPDKVLEISLDVLEQSDSDADEDAKPTSSGAGGNSGKTTYYATIAKLLGSYAGKVDRRVFEKQRGDQHPTHLAELEGLRFAYGAEISNTLDIEQVKDLTGERTIKARHMQEDMRSFKRTHKLAVFCNRPPKINKGADDPVWNRVHADCWYRPIENPMPEEQIDSIYEREAEGIFDDMVSGWVDYYSRGMKLDSPTSIKLSTEQYRAKEDPVREFIRERCEVGTDHEHYWVRSQELWDARRLWTKENKPNVHKYETKDAFLALVTDAGFPAGKSPDKLRESTRRGIRLKMVTTSSHSADGWVPPDDP